MEALFYFALALLNVGAPSLAVLMVAAIALALVGPVKLNLSIGDRSARQEPRMYDSHAKTKETEVHTNRKARPRTARHRP
jgi:hypothetical protein